MYIETWHATPLKRLGCDITTDSDPRQSKERMHRRYRTKGKKVTHFLSPSPYYTEKIASAFDVDPSQDGLFINSGYPRNDALLEPSEEKTAEFKKSLGIPEGAKVILYTPTWRDNEYQNGHGFQYESPVNLGKLMELLPENYI